MAFREKIAWAAFVTTVLIWGSCFALLALVGTSETSMMLLGLFIVATIAQLIGVFILAEAVRFGATAIGYRRGA